MTILLLSCATPTPGPVDIPCCPEEYWSHQEDRDALEAFQLTVEGRALSYPDLYRKVWSLDRYCRAANRALQCKEPDPIPEPTRWWEFWR